MKTGTLATIGTLLATLVLSAQAHAGATNIVLDCKTADGKVALTGDVPGDMADFSLEATLPKAYGKLISAWDENQKDNPNSGRVSVIEDFKNGVFTVYSESTSKNSDLTIRLYAFPKSVKMKPLPYGYEAHFTGHLSIWDRKGSGESKVICTAVYNI
jgi:hypothetical protein